MNENYILDLIGMLEQNKRRKQINTDIKQLEKTINALRITGVFADIKEYASRNPISVNVTPKKEKLNNDLTAYLNKNTKINESAVLLQEADRVRELIQAVDDKKSLREATDAFQLYKSEVAATGFNTKSTTDKIKGMLSPGDKIGKSY